MTEATRVTRTSEDEPCPICRYSLPMLSAIRKREMNDPISGMFFSNEFRSEDDLSDDCQPDDLRGVHYYTLKCKKHKYHC